MLRGTKPYKPITGIIAIAIALLIPQMIGTGPATLGQLDYVVAMLLVASGLNIVMGYAGQLFLGPGAIFAVSAYACAILANDYTAFQSLPVMCVIAILAGLVIALLAAVPALRVGGFYLGMITLFLALLIPQVASELNFAGGSEGISLLSNLKWNPDLSGVALYDIGVGMVVLVAAFSWAILHSKVGHRFVLLRESEVLAKSLGVNAYNTKLYAFLLSSIPAGLGGAFYVYSQQFMSPGTVTAVLSIYILAGVVIGGFGTVLGPLTGGILVLSLNQFLGSLNEYQGIALGIALIVISLALPRGLNSLFVEARATYQARFGKVRSKAAPKAIGRTPGAPSLVLSPRLDSSGTEELAVKGARKSFGGVKAVQAVDLVVKPGTVHALIGANGSGKTTLLNLICGFYKLDEGEVWVGAQRIDGKKPEKVLRSGVARTFQTPKLLGDRTILENVAVAVEQGTSCPDLHSVLHLPKGRRDYAEALLLATNSLKEVGIDGVADQLASAVPHGVQRLIEIARAISINPCFLLLDEPAAGLGPQEAELLKSAIVDISRAGVGVLLIEHNLNVVFDIASEVTVLDFGEVIAHGSPDEVRQAASVAEAYLGKVPTTSFSREGASGRSPEIVT